VCGMHHAQGDEEDKFLCLASKPRSMAWWFGPQNYHGGFLFWVSKPSGRRFVGLRIKIDVRMKTVRDTCQDLAACFAWKRVRLGFSSLALRLVEVRYGWCTWLHRDEVEDKRVKMKPKTNRSIRWAASVSSTSTLSFCCIRS
jgi:hypothetical protein